MAVSESEVFDGLASLVNDETGITISKDDMDKSFVDDLDIDSISMMTIVVSAEEKFGVEIPDEKVKDMRTVRDAVNHILKAAQDK